ncbi:MAG TPA: hypothetical protein VMT85_21175 [Thermoanaerobaculia bacterium]|nr:hypothetical protein [Thermoanaerobaculia bacterium]
MEIPADVLVHNDTLNLKGVAARLLRVNDGYYEINLQFGGNLHRVLLPVARTVLIQQEPEPNVVADAAEIER